ncbi:SDR family NAD(P)-dependent oxidoreductase [Stutzerimonas stutzeri]|uniref:SDR family NAD(P)-dependent oxidoreductase n=1 Tax=Stutzerimonas stutzeri TaxID=316 RepID=UPI00210E9662|nr:SDR family oxidoreductase [Stutzerimonas stutzeri]MCQ4322624.1 SDR family oxidoreductase [Stutzerimonas stutzeri]
MHGSHRNVNRYLDVSGKGEIGSVVAGTARHLGGLDVVINNAGISAFSAIGSDDYDQVRERAISVLVTGQQRLIRAALPHLRQSTSPRIVNIASTEALGATAENSPYAAAKAGVTGLTRALAVELGPEGISVDCICPGPIETAMTELVPPDHKVIFAKRRTALQRYGSSEEVAHITVSLCLPAASYLTGAISPIDGGLMARNA